MSRRARRLTVLGVVDPSNPPVIVGAYAELRTLRCGLARTTNGGETWTRIDPGGRDRLADCRSGSAGRVAGQPATGAGPATPSGARTSSAKEKV